MLKRNRPAYRRAAITAISTFQCRATNLASTQARPRVLPGDTQVSHTRFRAGAALVFYWVLRKVGDN
jgi:hypothetical protein